MAYLVELSTRAEQDLNQIAQRISAGESAAAVRWFDGLDKAISTLENFPATVLDYSGKQKDKTRLASFALQLDADHLRNRRSARIGQSRGYQAFGYG